MNSSKPLPIVKSRSTLARIIREGGEEEYESTTGGVGPTNNSDSTNQTSASNNRLLSRPIVMKKHRGGSTSSSILEVGRKPTNATISSGVSSFDNTTGSRNSRTESSSSTATTLIKKKKDGFPLAEPSTVAVVTSMTNDFPGLKRVLPQLQTKNSPPLLDDSERIAFCVKYPFYKQRPEFVPEPASEHDRRLAKALHERACPECHGASEKQWTLRWQKIVGQEHHRRDDIEAEEAVEFQRFIVKPFFQSVAVHNARVAHRMQLLQVREKQDRLKSQQDMMDVLQAIQRRTRRGAREIASRSHIACDTSELTTKNNGKKKPVLAAMNSNTEEDDVEVTEEDELIGAESLAKLLGETKEDGTTLKPDQSALVAAEDKKLLNERKKLINDHHALAFFFNQEEVERHHVETAAFRYYRKMETEATIEKGRISEKLLDEQDEQVYQEQKKFMHLHHNDRHSVIDEERLHRQKMMDEALLLKREAKIYHNKNLAAETESLETTSRLMIAEEMQFLRGYFLSTFITEVVEPQVRHFVAARLVPGITSAVFYARQKGGEREGGRSSIPAGGTTRQVEVALSVAGDGQPLDEILHLGEEGAAEEHHHHNNHHRSPSLSGTLNSSSIPPLGGSPVNSVGNNKVSPTTTKRGVPVGGVIHYYNDNSGSTSSSSSLLTPRSAAELALQELITGVELANNGPKHRRRKGKQQQQQLPSAQQQRHSVVAADPLLLFHPSSSPTGHDDGADLTQRNSRKRLISKLTTSKLSMYISRQCKRRSLTTVEEGEAEGTQQSTATTSPVGGGKEEGPAFSFNDPLLESFNIINNPLNMTTTSTGGGAGGASSSTEKVRTEWLSSSCSSSSRPHSRARIDGEDTTARGSVEKEAPAAGGDCGEDEEEMPLFRGEVCSPFELSYSSQFFFYLETEERSSIVLRQQIKRDLMLRTMGMVSNPVADDVRVKANSYLSQDNNLPSSPLGSDVVQIAIASALMYGVESSSINSCTGKDDDDDKLRQTIVSSLWRNEEEISSSSPNPPATNNSNTKKRSITTHRQAGLAILDSAQGAGPRRNGRGEAGDNHEAGKENNATVPNISSSRPPQHSHPQSPIPLRHLISEGSIGSSTALASRGGGPGTAGSNTAMDLGRSLSNANFTAGGGGVIISEADLSQLHDIAAVSTSPKNDHRSRKRQPEHQHQTTTYSAPTPGEEDDEEQSGGGATGLVDVSTTRLRESLTAEGSRIGSRLSSSRGTTLGSRRGNLTSSSSHQRHHYHHEHENLREVAASTSQVAIVAEAPPFSPPTTDAGTESREPTQHSK